MQYAKMVTKIKNPGLSVNRAGYLGTIDKLLPQLFSVK